MYGDVVLDMKPTSKEEIDPFEQIMEGRMARDGTKGIVKAGNRIIGYKEE